MTQMRDMEPMATNRRCLTWLCICPADDSANRWQKLMHATSAVTVLTAIMCGATGCFAFCWKFVSIDLGRSVFAFQFAAAEFTVVYMALVGIILLRHQIGLIFNGLAAIYKDNKNADSFHVLVEVSDASEWMWKLYLKYTPAATVMNIVVISLISALLKWFFGKDLSVANLYHPIPYVLPWNQTTRLGYIEEIIYSVPIGCCYCLVYGAFLLLFVSICQHHQAFHRMVKHSVANFKRSDDAANQSNAKFLCDLMRFHISVKDWFLHTADVYSPLVVVQMICSETMLAISIFFLDYQFQQHDNNVVIALTTITMAASNLLIYCYLGKVATESYEEMSNSIYNMEWYRLPIELQKYLILMIKNMQKPIYYHGFGVIYLNLETFTKLFKSAITYYMAIKAMTSK